MSKFGVEEPDWPAQNFDLNTFEMKPSKKSWSIYSCKGWADMILNPNLNPSKACEDGWVNTFGKIVYTGTTVRYEICEGSNKN